MRINSAIRAMFGITAAVGAMAASLPASAATVTINDSAGSASQSVSGTTPSITVLGVTIACNINFSITPASGITVGTAYTPPAVLGSVVAAGFTNGSTYCSSVKEYTGSAPAASVAGNTVLSASAPWPIEVTSVSSATAVNVTIQDFILYTPAFAYCAGNVTGTFNPSTNVLAIPNQTLTHYTAAGVASGSCTINSGVNLAVSPTGLISDTYP